MNQRTKQLLCLTALVSTAQWCEANTASTIVPRSQSFNAARQIVGWNNPEWGINRLPQDDYYSSFNIIFEYTRTFRPNRLAQSLFGNDLACGSCDDATLNILGSAVPLTTANPSRWLADYFGLPRDFQSSVTFKPTISNFILDFSFYAGLDGWVQGMYFKIYGPFVHTKWNLNAQECINNQGTLDYFQGYFSSVVVPLANLNTSFLDYTNGCTPNIVNDWNEQNQYEYNCLQALGCTPLGNVTWQPLCCSKIANGECGGLTRNGFGELRFVLGYNFINDENGDYHLGCGIYGAAPTGSRVGSSNCSGNGGYLFEPIVGNGKHWELGGQVTAHHIWWRSEDEDRSVGMYLEANVTHLFSACQTRCFDLCSAGSNSRYMLAERLQSNQATSPNLPQYPTGTPASFVPTIDILGLEFANEYAPVANITRRNITSSIAAQGDLAITISYQSGNFQWDVGYDFWGRSCEKINLENDCCARSFGLWALKGDQRVYGFTSFDATYPAVSELAVKMPVTDSQATINTGSNLANGVSYAGANPEDPVNFYADNSLRLSSTNTGLGFDYLILPAATTDIIYSSEKPILIQEDDFNTNGTRGISNKIFTHVNWAMPEYRDSDYTPYIGIGAEVEFGRTSETLNCTTNCDISCGAVCPTVGQCCTNCALSQWGIWLKMGASYN